jgi:DNA helicase-2/ATP-dependent DNA helicase PcrA
MSDSGLKKIKYSANEIYRVIRNFDLSEEKSVAIEMASTVSSSLIVAGAGSGKTELLAVRVLWLVANGICRPEEILGLTFTKKAAAELSKRIFESLLKLRESNYWPEELEPDFAPPNIATYNAYSNSLFRDFCLPLGYESETQVLSEAAAFQLAREVVLRHGSSIEQDINVLEAGLDSLVEAVLAMASQLNDNQVSAGEVSAGIERAISHISTLPKKVGQELTSTFAYIEKIIGPLRGTPAIAELAELFQREKMERSLVDYSDQVALAERAAREIPELSESQRQQYPHVLLDEYQDTSFLQTKLLSQLFRGNSVFAVGDPNQSIYGWRGASSSNLDDFSQDFGETKTFQLATSWRNPKRVLAVANLIAEPLSAKPGFLNSSNSSGSVKPVELVANPDAIEGEVRHVFAQDMISEAREVANWFKSNQSDKSSQALLFRARSSMQLFVDELESAGLDVEVIGLGGLLEMPELVDLVSALKVIYRPESGSELIRLLTGARFRIGLKDIERLHRLGKKFGTVDSSRYSSDDQLSLIEVLDQITSTKHPFLSNFSEVGLARLKEAAVFFRNLRSAVGLPLPEFVRIVAEELWLDIELKANPKRSNPMGHLNAFYEVVTNYSLGSGNGQLGVFLNWLDYANQRERFETPRVNPAAGVVQVLTIHAAKGLEWDFVAVPNLVDGDFPSLGRGVSGWLSIGQLPYPLRGDSSSLPVFEFEGAQTQPETNLAYEKFKADNREYKMREETRLMYVAATRPRKGLLLSGSYWKPANKKPRNPSEFFLLSSGGDFQLSELDSQENPLDVEEKNEAWPAEPLGASHRSHLENLASQARSAEGDLDSYSRDQLLEHSIHRDIDLLVLERDAALNRLDEVRLPVRIPASRFKDFLNDEDQQAKRMLRPMPTEPYRATRTGTLFHSWLEDYFSELEGVESATQNFEELKTVFANSRFAQAVPVEIELEINLTRGLSTFVCKLDAVFTKGDGVEIVDWKTGKSPTSEEEKEQMTLQLALYRFAYSVFRKIPIEKVFVSFYFVSENLEMVPEVIPSPEELLENWSRVGF